MKNAKKILLIFMAFAISVVFLGCTIVSKNDDNSVIYSDDFESCNPGEMPEGWEIMYNGSGDTNQGVFEIDGNKCLVADGTEGNSAVLTHEFYFPDAIIKAEYAAQNIDEPGGMLFSDGVLGSGTLINKGWHEYITYLDFINGKRMHYEDGVLVIEGELADATTGWLGTASGRKSCFSIDSSNINAQNNTFLKYLTLTIVDEMPAE